MNLYILRHASAGTSRENPLLDVKRPLDKEGKQQCLLVGSYCVQSVEARPANRIAGWD
jgi:phosphohistidine phosphatase